MEESKELQGFYKIFRAVIYISVLMEFFEYAIDPRAIDGFGGVVCDLHDRIKQWFIYHDGNLVYSKVVTFLLVCITCVGTRNKKHLEFDARKQVLYPLVSGVLLLVLSVWIFGYAMDTRLYALRLNIILYMVTTIIGTVLVHIALDNISKFLKEGLMKDRFNFENESFEQCQKEENNKYSVNIPMRYYYKGKFRKGWVNIVNPFRGTWVVGTPGSGKTFSIIEPFIRQHSAKGFAMVVYDYKFPTLATKLYYHYKKNQQLGKLPEGCKFNIINFVDVEYSKRVNPIQQKYINNLAAASETAETLLESLQKGKKEGGGGSDQFFQTSAVNFLAACIYFFINYGKEPYDKDGKMLIAEKVLDPKTMQMKPTGKVFNHAGEEVDLLVYFLVPKRAKNGVLLLSSLVFYGWGEPRYLPVMLVSSLQGYIFGRLIERFRDTRRAKLFLVLSVLLSLGTLAYFKYADFMIANLNALTGLSAPLLRLALPVGISFYTFQIASYEIDVYRGDVAAQHNFIDFAAYVAMFPQLIAGPIVRYRDIAPQLKERTHSLEAAASGASRFAVGLGKKVLVANVLAQLVSAYKASAEQTALYAWLYTIAFTLQIYFDFSGYSDMAIGLGRIFGFSFPENFRYPYIAKSITEFWRRWHMSLGTWFRDYLYIPLGGSRCSRIRHIFNILVVWMATGFWHGAQWNFILWGLYYAVLLLCEKLLWGEALKKLPSAVQWIYTMLLVIIGWVLFDKTDFAQLGHVIGVMFSFVPTGWTTLLAGDVSKLFNLAFIIPGILFSFPVAGKLHIQEKGTVSAIAVNLMYIALLAVCIAFIISSSYNPFIYFRF